MSCGNMVVFRVNPIDARTLEQNFVKDGTFAEEGLWQLPLYEAMVKVACGTTTQQARVQTYAEQGEENEVVAGLIRQESRAYGRPRAEVEEGIAQVVSQASNVTPRRLVQSREPLWWE
jgi:hypothetical protein